MKSKKMELYLQKSIQEKFALPAFNTLNMECIQVIVDGAEEANAPVILQITESSIKYAGFDYINQILEVADRSPNVFVHLDHGTSDINILNCIKSNAFSSVMIDRSKESFEQNIKDTINIKTQANNKLVESELGIVGGKEEDIIAEGSIYTDIDEAIDFVARTKIDLFAPAVGTAHGIYKDTPKLNYELINKLREKISIPLVLHGSSGLSDEQVKLCIQAGMNKVNIDTELKQNFIQGFLQYMDKNPEAYDLRQIFGAAKASMKEIVLHKIRICGAEGKI